MKRDTHLFVLTMCLVHCLAKRANSNANNDKRSYSKGHNFASNTSPRSRTDPIRVGVQSLQIPLFGDPFIALEYTSIGTNDPPNDSPTGTPMLAPSEHPSAAATLAPTMPPTKQPADIPTKQPTGLPTSGLSESPSGIPSQVPSWLPTPAGTGYPTIVPSPPTQTNSTAMPTVITGVQRCDGYIPVSVSLGPRSSPVGSFNNLPTSQALSNVLDCLDPNEREEHTFESHVWWIPSPLELIFVFDGEYDIRSILFWNNDFESLDVDQIDFEFFNSDDESVTNYTVQPRLGQSPTVAETFQLPGNSIIASKVTALLTSTEGEIDFQNIGFQANDSPSIVPATDAPTTPIIDSPSGSPAISPSKEPTEASTDQPTESRTAAPSTATTGAPTVSTAAPTTDPSTALTIQDLKRVIKAMLQYGFYPDIELREPTREEIDGLIEQTVLFYTDLLTQEFGDGAFTLEIRENFNTWTPTDARPFLIDFDAIVTFNDNVIDPVPTNDDVFATMEATMEIYADYIRSYVWNSQPDGTVFFDVQNVGFDRSSVTTAAPTMATTGAPTPSIPAPTSAPTVRPTGAPTARPTEAPTITRVVNAMLEYGFFPDTELREPTREEIDGLLEQTILFYTDLLNQEFGPIFDLQIQENFNTWTPTDARPFLLDFDAIVMFNEGADPVPTNDDVFATMEATMEIYADYIRSYVWNSQPDGTVFFDVQNVGFDRSSATTAVPTMATTGAPTPSMPAPTFGPSLRPTGAPTVRPTEAPTITRVVNAMLEYGFYPDTQLREPTREEIDGLLEQTSLFYTDLLNQEFGPIFDLQIQENFNTWTPTDARPFLLDFDAIVMFNEGADPVPTNDDVFATMEATMEIYAGYIRNYVWNSAPDGTIFFDVNNVGFDRSSGGGLPTLPLHKHS